MRENSSERVYHSKFKQDLLVVKGLAISNKEGDQSRPFINEINFEVKRGHFIALMGKSGIGKTLTIKAILGLLEEHFWNVEGDIVFYQKKPILCPITGESCVRDSHAVYSQKNNSNHLPIQKLCPLEASSELYCYTKEDNDIKIINCPMEKRELYLLKKDYILKDGKYNRNLLSELMGKKIFTVFQGADSHLNPSLNIGWQIGEVINPQKPWKGTEGEVKRCLGEVRIEPNRFKNYPHQFAQGQRQRIMIAMALGQSDLLICDELTSALDEKVKQEIIDILKDLRKKSEITSMILITHDKKVIENLFEDEDTVYVMDEGERGINIVNPGGTKMGEIRDLQRKEDGGVPDFVNLHPLLENRDFSWFVKPKTTKGLLKKNTILSIRNLKQGYRQGIWRKMIWVLDGINLDVEEGEFFGIVGKSGCGKTTLAKSIARLLDNTEGEILYYHEKTVKGSCYKYWDWDNLIRLQPNGKKPDCTDMRKLRRELQLIFQDSASVFNPSMTIRELFSETLELLGVVDVNERLNRIKETLIKLEICKDDNTLGNILDKYPKELSGGEKQRLSIARNFLLNPRLVIADEPFSDQDKITEKEIIQIMNKMRNFEGTTFIIISHDLELMERICDRVAIMEGGRIKKKDNNNLFLE